MDRANKRRHSPPAAFPTLAEQPPRRQKTDAPPMQKQDSANPDITSIQPQSSSSPTYPGKGTVGHGIPLILSNYNTATEYTPNEKRHLEREQRFKNFMTSEKKAQQERYEKDLEEKQKHPFIARNDKYDLITLPNIYDNPKDDFNFQESMASCDEEEEEDETTSSRIKKLHLTLQNTIIKEIEKDVKDVQHLFPPCQKDFFASKILLHMDSIQIDDVLKQKQRNKFLGIGDAILPRKHSIETAVKFLNLKKLPISLIESHLSDQDRQAGSMLDELRNQLLKD